VQLVAYVNGERVDATEMAHAPSRYRASLHGCRFQCTDCGGMFEDDSEGIHAKPIIASRAGGSCKPASVLTGTTLRRPHGSRRRPGCAFRRHEVEMLIVDGRTLHFSGRRPSKSCHSVATEIRPPAPRVKAPGFRTAASAGLAQ
jgi:hypothetical protein